MGEEKAVICHKSTPLRISCRDDLSFAKGGFFMGRRRRPRLLLGVFLIAVGAIIILSMILPAGFWWFILGLGLIALGIWFLRC